MRGKKKQPWPSCAIIGGAPKDLLTRPDPKNNINKRMMKRRRRQPHRIAWWMEIENGIDDRGSKAFWLDKPAAP